MTIDEKRQRYLDLCHAMQSGVAMKMNYEGNETSPKHLRTGVNAAMSDGAALAKLLMDKGIITLDEYYDALIESMEREVKMYEDWLNNWYKQYPTSNISDIKLR